jgi:hypothetical protein
LIYPPRGENAAREYAQKCEKRAEKSDVLQDFDYQISFYGEL